MGGFGGHMNSDGAYIGLGTGNHHNNNNISTNDTNEATDEYDKYTNDDHSRSNPNTISKSNDDNHII